MSTLKTHNLQSPDASSVNIALTPNAGMVVTGVSTFSDNVRLLDNDRLQIGNSQDLELFHNGTNSHIRNNTGALVLNADNLLLQSLSENYLSAVANGALKLFFNNAEKLETTNTGIVITGICTATSFSGDGSNLTNLPPSAPVGGSASNKVFFENDKVVSVNYQITSTKNAMTAGPISINSGIGVTVPSGCSWTIV